MHKTELTKVPGFRMVTQVGSDFMHIVYGGVLIDFAHRLGEEPEVGYVQKRTKAGVQLHKEIDDMIECKCV